jgi:hypothetical protein
MGNMSYCRFQNTLADLRDCAEHFDEAAGPEEKIARNRLVQVCRDIVGYAEDAKDE